MTVGSYWSQK